MNLLDQGFKIFAWFDQFVGMPFGIAIGPEKGPLFRPGIKPELSGKRFLAHPGFGKGWTFLVESDMVSSKPEPQPHFVVEINRQPLAAVNSKGLFDLFSRDFR
jgi:hypothetical protein